MNITEMIYWDHYYNMIQLINLSIVIVLFILLRLFLGAIVHINTSHELFKKDNPAFGISLAAATLAVTIMLSGTVYGDGDSTIFDSALSVGLFGLFGILLMALTRMIFEKITLSSILIRDEIVKGNIAVAIADAGNVLAAAIIIRAIMIWVTAASIEGITILLGGYALSQIVLTVMTVIAIKFFGRLNKDADFYNELNTNNIALAVRFAGEKIGAAFAIATAAQIVVYDEYNIINILAAWFIVLIGIVIIWRVLSWLTCQIILYKADINDEVVRQKNVAVGALQAVIYISIGLLILQL
ncbi:MAG: DUF350 domain-containing protein [Alphaproteobacteria bacterium]|nr:DUF350 domain-containing protein [Alphaproteobacteria bacterium]